ncbi:hypothetical protein [Raoultella ornithinolytica]|uniref:hypothetical protein n=1 Tax=Raoultella ornithinolytica TaxID=54291 RepID=UPI001F180A8F|nr:hypothetical protein [Raoultella ornithinolytica]
MAELNPPLGTTTPEIFLDNVERADRLVNGPEATVPDRGGEPLDSWRLMMAKNDEVRQNLIPLSKQYLTLAAAQADIANIPVGSTTYYRSPDDSALALEVMNVAGTLTATGRRMPSQYAVANSSITSGDIFSSLSPRGAALNGGSVITDASNRIIGLLVPAGSTGGSSYFCSDIPAAALRGRTVKITQIYTATKAWLSTVNLNTLRAQSRAGSTVSTLAVTDYSVSQNGTVVTQTATVVVPADADYVGLAFQYASNAAVKSADMSIQLAQTGYIMLPVSGSVVTQNDGMLDLRLAPISAAVGAAQATANSALLTSGDVWGDNVSAKGTGAALNGAATIQDSSGNVIGLSIPASAGTAQGSYVTSWMSAEGLSGHTLNITATFTTSAGWSTDPAPNTLALQVRRSTGQVNIAVGSGATRTITQNGTTMTIAIQYTVDPADIDIGVCYQVAGGNAAKAYSRSMQTQAISYTVVPAAGETLNKTMLSIFIDEAIRQLQNGGETITVTVKPSGGDYTHPKLALDHITDATALKRYVIAVYPGTYTGYAEWATKDYVDIIGMGRKQEIIVSYDSGDDADQATVRGTSLFWMASETLLKNLTLKIKNGRYCIHMEGNGAAPDVTMAIEDCSVIHEGNASDTYWWQPSQYGVGAGLSAGNTVRLRNSYLEGRGGGFSFHTPNNRVSYTKPIFVDIEGCVCVNARTLSNTGYPYEAALSIKPITKGAADSCRLVGNTFINGKVYYSTGEWLDTADTTTNRAQVQMWGHGNAGFEFYSDVPYTPNMTGLNS